MSKEKKRSIFWGLVLPLMYIAVLIINSSLGLGYSVINKIIIFISIAPFGLLLFYINTYWLLFLSIPANILFWGLVGYFIIPKVNRLVPKKLEKKNDIGHWLPWGILFIFLVAFGIYFVSPSRDCAVNLNLKMNTGLYKADRNVCFARSKYVGEEVGGKGIIFEAEVFSIADYDSFEYVLAREGNQKVYYKDKNNVYLLKDNEVIILEDIDPASFDENYFEEE